MIAIILDGHGKLHVASTRAPDLLRREFKTKTAAAELLYCQLPIRGVSVAELIDQFERRLKFVTERFGQHAVPAQPALIEAIQRVAFQIAVVELVKSKFKNGPVRFLRRVANRFKSKLEYPAKA